MSDQIMSGPCQICGAFNYPLSFGGPSICPSCDCGNFGRHVVQRQADEITRLRAELSAVLEENTEWRRIANRDAETITAAHLGVAAVREQAVAFVEARAALCERSAIKCRERNDPNSGELDDWAALELRTTAADVRRIPLPPSDTLAKVQRLVAACRHQADSTITSKGDEDWQEFVAALSALEPLIGKPQQSKGDGT